MGSHWFLKPLVADVTAVSIEADMERVFVSPLHTAFPALDEVDDIHHLAGCCCSYMVGADSGSAHESIIGLDVLAFSASG